MWKEIKKNNIGISLLELIVGVGIFSLTIVSAADIFKYVLIGQRNAIAAQNVQESMRFTFETMAKEIRAARESDGACAGMFAPEPEPSTSIYNKTANSEGEILYFENAAGLCTAYYLTNGTMMISRGSQTASTTSSRIMIKNLKFEIADNAIGSATTAQPRMTMKMDVEAKGDEMNKQKMELQTTISSRFYEGGKSAQSETPLTTGAKANSQSCLDGSECQSGFCADGVCCNTACTGSTCQRCDAFSSNGAGTCGFAASDQDPDNECAAAGCSGTGNCSGTGYSCAIPAADTDPNNFCAAYTCSNYIYGWSGTSCVLYSGASAHNGMCDGSGSCYNVANSCSGIGAQSGSAICGSAGCKSSCVSGGLATNYNTVGEVCYTSGQASCGVGSYCNASGTCINPCAGQPQDSQPSGCNGTCQYCDGSGVCRTMRWSQAGGGGGYSFSSGTNRYCKPSTRGQQGVTNESYNGDMSCTLGPAAAGGSSCCGQYLWTCGY